MKIIKIYLDMDDCIVNWSADFPSNMTHQEVREKISKIDHFFLHLKPMPDADKLVTYLKSLNIPLAILSALPYKYTVPHAEEDKREWVKQYIDRDMEFNVGPYAVDKQNFSGPGKILIDDKIRNIKQWNAKGGIGIVYKDFNSCKEEIEKLLKGG